MPIIIDGIEYEGANIVFAQGGIIFVDGQEVTPKTKEIVIHGNVKNLTVYACPKISIAGNAGSIRLTAGNITVGKDVQENIETVSGNVTCRNVKGTISTTSGSIHRRT